MQRINKWSLLWPVLASILLPLVAAYFAYPVDHLPPKFGIFPPEFVIAQPKFLLSYFLLVLLAATAVVVFLLFPGLFGFRSAPIDAAHETPQRCAPPWWFWAGLTLCLFFWWVMWARPPVVGSLVYYAFTPLWWGFILALDGLVYSRTGGKSLVATRPTTLLASALVSVAGWSYFEFYDYFVLSNWYYPNGHMPQISHATIVALFLIAYSTAWPAVFEWFTLLNTFPRLVARYANGPKLALPGTSMLVVGLGLIFLMVFAPAPLFWVLWIAPMAVIGGQLIRKGIPSPFSALAEGNWSPMILMALSSLCNGFLWECWNYGSAQPNVPPTNPNYWIYDIPYVNVIHIYSEMPLLGYFGYLPFGILVWLVFIWAGRLLDFNTSLSLDAQASDSTATDWSNRITT